MTKEEMMLTSQLEALREVVKAMEKTIAAQKETIAALEKRVDVIPAPQPVYIPAPQPVVNPPYNPYGGETVIWGGSEGLNGNITITNTSTPPAKPFLSAFTVNMTGGSRESRL